MRIFVQLSLSMEDRSEFLKGHLSEIDSPDSPFKLLKNWIEGAQKMEVDEYSAMVLSTNSSAGSPSSRIVYLRDFHQEGLVFYTNYNSKKGREIAHDNRVAVNFFWKELEQQIRIEGIANKVSDQISNKYFDDRPRGSQIGAWASYQSEQLSSRSELEGRVREFEEKFADSAVPRPPHWGGYVIFPDYYEFWQGRKGRLHDRMVYQKDADGWTKIRLSP